MNWYPLKTYGELLSYTNVNGKSFANVRKTRKAEHWTNEDLLF